MQPTEKGGVILENTAELALSLSTLSASIQDMRIGAESPAGNTQSRQLHARLISAMDNDEKTLELNSSETSNLRDACQIATTNYHYSLGVVSCFQSMTRVPEQALLAVMDASSNPLFERASLIVQTGHSAPVQLAGMLALYSAGPGVAGE